MKYLVKITRTYADGHIDLLEYVGKNHKGNSLESYTSGKLQGYDTREDAMKLINLFKEIDQYIADNYVGTETDDFTVTTDIVSY